MNADKRWTLRDATRAERESPYTFYRPSETILARLEPGDLVKVAFDFDPPEGGPSGERMWLEILSRSGDTFRGRLANEPTACPDLKFNDTVDFSTSHIISTQYADPKSDAMDRFFQRCFVSSAVMREGRPVGRLYREPPDTEDDSGWRLMAGDEPDGFFDDSKNILYIAIGAVLNRDDSFASLLDSPEGSAFERSADGKYAPVQS